MVIVIPAECREEWERIGEERRTGCFVEEGNEIREDGEEGVRLSECG